MNEANALIGISFGNTIFYNIIKNDSTFELSGLSIVNFLKNNKNKFISDFFAGQCYSGFDFILDNEIKFGEFISLNNLNVISFNDIYGLYRECDIVQHVYVYDINRDVLFVKIPSISKMIALDYKNEFDIREFRKKHK